MRTLQGSRRHWWFATGFAAAITFHTARATLDDALGALHPANELPYGTNRLHDGPTIAAQALASWDRGSAEFASFLRGTVDGRTLARLHTLAEVGYTMVVSGLLLILAAWVFDRLGRDSDEVGYLRRGIVRWAGYLVPVYLALGLLDQILDWILLRAIPRGDPLRLSGSARTAARVLQLSSLTRRLTLLAIVAPLVIGLLAIARHARRHRAPDEGVFAGGSPYRVLIAVIALYMAIVNFGAAGEQATDAIRLWSSSPRLIVVAVVASFWLSATVFVIARRLGRAVDPPGRPASEWRLTRRLAGAGAVLAVIGFGVERIRHWGGGVGMLGLIAVVVAGLNALLLMVVPPEIATESAAESATKSAAAVATPSQTASVVTPEITSEIPITVAGAIAEPAVPLLSNPSPPNPSPPEPAPANPSPPEPAPANPSPFLPSFLGLLPYIVLGRTILRAAIPEAISPGGSMLLAPICLGVVAMGCVLYVISRRPTFFGVGSDPARFNTAFGAWLGGSVAVLAIVTVWTWFHPWTIGRLLGVHGLLPVFLTGLTVAIGGLSYLTERWPVPGALRLLGIRRIPIVSIILAWGIASSLLSSNFHEIRTIESPVPSGERTFTAAGAFTEWTNAADLGLELPDGTTTAAPVAAGRKPVVPMVFVAAAGGGIRAAGFTSLVLDCLLARIDITVCEGSTLANNWTHVFALSGASGGSVGIASTTAQLHSTGRADGWVARRLGGDLLSASLAWQLFVEVPNTFLHLSPDMDRAEVIERSWERRWGDDLTTDPVTGTVPPNPAVAGILGATHQWSGPLLMLNGTNLRDSCRVNISRLDGADPAVESTLLTDAELDCRRQRLDDTPVARSTLAVNRDLGDYLCATEDVRLSTAAFLSARFPFSSPTGELRSAPDRGQTCPRTDLPPLAIADGGYRDNTGASALLETWSEVAPLVAQHNNTMPTCIVPVFIEIDNGYRNRNATAAPGRLGQMLAPLTGAAAVFASRDAGWIEEAANQFSRDLGPGVRVVDSTGAVVTDRFTRLSLFAHPGVQAPLGWSLSPQAVDDIAGQLAVPENAAAIAEVVKWLTPDSLTCEVG